MNNRVLPRWASVRLDRVTYEDVAAWVAEMSTAVSPPTTQQAYHLLTSMLDQAVKGRRLPMNQRPAWSYPASRAFPGAISATRRWTGWPTPVGTAGSSS